MARIRLTQIDGKLPNLALMKLAHYHRSQGDEPYFSRILHRELIDVAEPPDLVYGSAIFSFSAERVARFQFEWPQAVVGGTHNLLDNRTVEQLIGREEYEHYDYSICPQFDGSIGFTQRGCRFKCGFCVVPKKEGKPRSVNSIADIWRGRKTPEEDRAWKAMIAKATSKERKENPGWFRHPEGTWPKHLHLLDNDFFGQPRELWQARIREIRDGGFKVCLNQGINVRMIDDESAAALASIPIRDDGFTVRRLYTAWDNLGDEQRFFRGVDTLERHGIKPSCLMVYMLCGYKFGETWEQLLYRFDRMRERGIKPYPMIYGERHRRLEPDHPTLGARMLSDFQRWAIRKYYTVVSFEKYDQSAKDKLTKIDGQYRPTTAAD